MNKIAISQDPHEAGDPWVGADFDGTLARYDKFISLQHYGEPIPEMVEFVKHLLAMGVKVKLFTARVCELSNEFNAAQGNPYPIEAIREDLRNWTLLHIGTALEATNVKDFLCCGIIDDRAIPVVRNKGIIPLIDKETYLAQALGGVI